MRPRVSVLIPVRDGETTLDRAVGSVLAQTFSDLEVVVVDDGSTDGTGRLLEAFAARDGRVRIVRGEARGIVAALNDGLSHCRGEFVARMDADDECLPERLSRQVHALDADLSLAGVGTGVELFRDDRPVSPNMQAYGAWLSSLTTPEALFRDRFVESPLCHPAVMVRREVLGDAPFREGPFPEDYELWLRLLSSGHAFRALPEVLVRWRDHDRRLTRTSDRYSEDAHRELKAEYLSNTVLAREKRCVIWGAGKTGLPLMRSLRARGVETVAFVEVDARKVGTKIEGIPIFPIEAFPEWHRAHVLAAVGAKGARGLIRAFFAERGVEEGSAFTCVA